MCIGQDDQALTYRSKIGAKQAFIAIKIMTKHAVNSGARFVQKQCQSLLYTAEAVHGFDDMIPK